jgi:site-specific DNA recombinase
MFEMVIQGVGCFKIAKTLSGKKWEARTVSRIVRNPAYMGVNYFGQTIGKKHKVTQRETWQVLPDVTPAIISKELFKQAQKALAKSKELHPGQAQHEYPLTGFTVCGSCGSPLVGACLSKRYRYYKCRGTYATASREKICDAHYIKADWLENAVWENVKRILSNPEVLLNEVKKQTEDEQARVSTGTLEQEIRVLTRKLKGYTGQERRLMSAFKLGFTTDIVLDEINQMKKEREADKQRLDSLVQTRDNIAKMVDMESNLKELCARIVPDLDNCTNSDKKDACTYLDLKVKATPEGADIKGFLDPCLLTTGQTSA